MTTITRATPTSTSALVAPMPASAPSQPASAPSLRAPGARDAGTVPAPALPPLHLRTPQQLKEGMVVAVKGSSGGDDLAVARLIQDGAQFMARRAGTTMGLANVDVNYRQADQQGALGLATFHGTKGWFALSQRSTQGLVAGIQRLREKEFGAWTEGERQDFVQANETILHEAAHVTLPAYDRDSVNAFHRSSRPLEEGLTEVATMHAIGDFLKEEFGVDVPPLTDRISQSTSAYTRYSERLERLLGMGTDGSRAAVGAAASVASDDVRNDLRPQWIAAQVAANLGGPAVPTAMVDEFAKLVPGFVDEKNGTRTALMTLQAAMVDLRRGAPVDVEAVLSQVSEQAAGAGRGSGEPEPVGHEPID